MNDSVPQELLDVVTRIIAEVNGAGVDQPTPYGTRYGDLCAEEARAILVCALPFMRQWALECAAQHCEARPSASGLELAGELRALLQGEVPEPQPAPAR